MLDLHTNLFKGPKLLLDFTCEKNSIIVKSQHHYLIGHYIHALSQLLAYSPAAGTLTPEPPLQWRDQTAYERQST